MDRNTLGLLKSKLQLCTFFLRLHRVKKKRERERGNPARSLKESDLFLSCQVIVSRTLL